MFERPDTRFHLSDMHFRPPDTPFFRPDNGFIHAIDGVHVVHAIQVMV